VLCQLVSRVRICYAYWFTVLCVLGCLVYTLLCDRKKSTVLNLLYSRLGWPQSCGALYWSFCISTCKGHLKLCHNVKIMSRHKSYSALYWGFCVSTCRGHLKLCRDVKVMSRHKSYRVTYWSFCVSTCGGPLKVVSYWSFCASTCRGHLKLCYDIKVLSRHKS